MLKADSSYSAMQAIASIVTLVLAFWAQTASADLGGTSGLIAPGAALFGDDLIGIADRETLLAQQKTSESLSRCALHDSDSLRVRTIDATALDAPVPGLASDLAVNTRVRTCYGVSVTITSFGGGEWDAHLDSFCDAAPGTDPSSGSSEEP